MIVGFLLALAGGSIMADGNFIAGVSIALAGLILNNKLEGGGP